MSDVVGNVSQALDILEDCMRQNPFQAWILHCNIAVSIMDEGGSHEQANKAAARVMKQLFDVDMTTFDEWKRFPWAGK